MVETLSQILPIFLLVAIFSFKFGSSQLICWRCDPCPNPHDNSSALVTAVTCASSQTFCAKNTIQVFNQPAEISKGCVSSCTPSSSDFFGQGDFVDCCNTNYCNSSRRTQLSFVFFIIIAFIFYYQ